MSSWAHTLTVSCPECGDGVQVAITVHHDPGCWRTRNGDGWPESWEYDVHTESCGYCGSCINEKWSDRLDQAFAKSHYPEDE